GGEQRLLRRDFLPDGCRSRPGWPSGRRTGDAGRVHHKAAFDCRWPAQHTGNQLSRARGRLLCFPQHQRHRSDQRPVRGPGNEL
ncbi:uncharacterized protein METZ01_LOCUS140086, partial [marine metagenome]